MILLAGVIRLADVEDRVELTCLMDFYGPLLTEHRREVTRLYCEEDLSLSEIADQLGITRQGVSDALNKARRQLTDYEAKLSLASRYRRVTERAEACMRILDGLDVQPDSRDGLRAARDALNELLQIER